MIFIETENLNLKVPSKDNLAQWTKYINSSTVRRTVNSAIFPKTIEMQWEWINNELNSQKRLLLEICDKFDNRFLGVVSLSSIDFKKRSAQIATISPFQKNKKNRFCVYEARRGILKYAFEDLSLSKVWGLMFYPENKSFLINNMCIGFEIEGMTHASRWHDNAPINGVNYFMLRSHFKKANVSDGKFEQLLSKDNRMSNELKLNKIINLLQSD